MTCQRSVILESLGSNLDGKVYRDFSEKGDYIEGNHCENCEKMNLAKLVEL